MVACKGSVTVAILPAVKPRWMFLLVGLLMTPWAAGEGVDAAVQIWHGPRLSDQGEAVDAALVAGLRAGFDADWSA